MSSNTQSEFDVGPVSGMKITVMGLGLHGGGVASARFFAERGAEVTATDLRDEETLRPSLEKLADLPVRYVLGRHENRDFTDADMVIKNPAVPKSSPYLQKARQVETDISIFLRLNKRPVIGITGSKGKSTTSSAVAELLRGIYPATRLGGNITVSPLTFLEGPGFIDCKDPDTNNSDIRPRDSRGRDTPIVLELSSWQLADLEGKNVLKPRIAAVTVILPDHMNRYTSMEDYVYDKSLLLRDMQATDTVVLNYDDPYYSYFTDAGTARVFPFSQYDLPKERDGGWLDESGRGWFRQGGASTEQLLPENIRLPGPHNRLNLLCAGIIGRLYGMQSETIASCLQTFSGIPHRLEFVAEKGGISFFNDSAATIPEATVAAVNSFSTPVILITGGTDKNLHFDVFRSMVHEPKRIVLLGGSATEKMKPIIEESGRDDVSEFSSLEEAFHSALASSAAGDIVVFSPGCASFELFLNEFDRGNQFKALVDSL